MKIGVLRNFAKFTGKHVYQRLFFNKVAGLRAATLLKKRLWHRCFPVKFEKVLRTPIFTEHLWWLLLWITCQVEKWLKTSTIFILSYILGFWIWWYRYQSLQHENKLTTHLLIFNQVTSFWKVHSQVWDKFWQLKAL